MHRYLSKSLFFIPSRNFEKLKRFGSTLNLDISNNFGLLLNQKGKLLLCFVHIILYYTNILKET